MIRYKKLAAAVGVMALLAAACAGDTGGGADGGGGQQAEVKPGGTLKMALTSDVSHAFDPQKEYYAVSWEFFRCCLLRTLLTYNGKPAEEGGNELHPDLAEGMPEISKDKKTWTFTIKEGVKYAPPFDDKEVVAQDFVRAIEREADPAAAAEGYSFYYSVIEGFDDSEGEPGSIPGIKAVDDQTLEVTTTEPTGDLGFRFAMPATAPIPEGAAEGHVKDYGRFLATTGPYMFEGSDQLDPTAPPAQQKPVSGYEPGRSITLVRNPSYDKATDGLRPAYVDKIEVGIGGTEEDLANQVDAGQIDIVFDGVPPAQQLREYATDPELKDQLHSDPSDGVRYLSINIAEPPFDDVHVRKAVNFVIDKDGLRRIRGGEIYGPIAPHAIVDTLLDDQLADYDPYATPNNAGDPAKAKAEMKLSKYDKDGDGVCDDPLCEGVLALTDSAAPYPDQASLINDNLKEIGISADVKELERTTMYTACNTPDRHVALCLGPGWFKDYSDATTFAEPLFGNASIGPDSCCNYSLVGADAKQLKDFGYEASSVPSVDDKIAECEPLLGDERITCYVELDQQIMEEVVPWVPYLFDNGVHTVSSRLLNYTHSSFAGNMALDHAAIDTGGGQ